MSRVDASARRSGDPRRRAAEEAPDNAGSRAQVLVVGLVSLAAVLVIAFAALGGGEEEPDDAARGHAEVACDLTTKAEEASRGDSDARFAAAVLLLDNALIESARAAEADASYADLDQAVQDVHAAGHTGDADQWRTTLDTALTACRDAVG